jgi:hypothetical protein
MMYMCAFLNIFVWFDNHCFVTAAVYIAVDQLSVPER